MSDNTKIRERDSLRALVDESKETEKISKALHACLKRDRKSVDRMRAVRLNIGDADAKTLPPETPVPIVDSEEEPKKE